jgi:hypothetical protein
VVVMENLFHQRRISRIFDLKGVQRQVDTRNKRNQEGSDRQSSAAHASMSPQRGEGASKAEERRDGSREDAGPGGKGAEGGRGDGSAGRRRSNSNIALSKRTLLDDNLLEYTDGRPLPLSEANKRPFQVCSR